MKIDSAEVINELNLECECAREVLAAMQAQRDSARDLAVALEQENALLSWLIAEVRWYFDSATRWMPVGISFAAPWLP